MTPDPWDLEVLARTVFGEARGEDTAGRFAVAWVVRNRASDFADRWPMTLARVCLQPWQFSCWWEPGVNREQTIATGSADPVMQACRAAARETLIGNVIDTTDGANHYLADVLAATAPPSWYDPAKVTARIGRHVFLKL